MAKLTAITMVIFISVQNSFNKDCHHLFNESLGIKENLKKVVIIIINHFIIKANLIKTLRVSLIKLVMVFKLKLIKRDITITLNIVNIAYPASPPTIIFIIR